MKRIKGRKHKVQTITQVSPKLRLHEQRSLLKQSMWLLKSDKFEKLVQQNEETGRRVVTSKQIVRGAYTNSNILKVGIDQSENPFHLPPIKK